MSGEIVIQQLVLPRKLFFTVKIWTVETGLRGGVFDFLCGFNKRLGLFNILSVTIGQNHLSLEFLRGFLVNSLQNFFYDCRSYIGDRADLAVVEQHVLVVGHVAKFLVTQQPPIPTVFICYQIARNDVVSSVEMLGKLKLVFGAETLAV